MSQIAISSFVNLFLSFSSRAYPLLIIATFISFFFYLNKCNKNTLNLLNFRNYKMLFAKHDENYEFVTKELAVKIQKV